MKISLVVMTAGKAAGQTIPIPTAQFIIGRDPQCNLRPASAMISKRHCAILVKNNKLYLHDFGSTNGTFLNELPVKGEVPLKNEDLLKVGPLTFKVVLEGMPEPAKQTLPPPPQPRKSDIMDEDAAAMMLSVDDVDSEPAVITSTETEDVPEGTTLMDIPIPNLQEILNKSSKHSTEPSSTSPQENGSPQTESADTKPAESKPPENKPVDTKKKAPAGSAQDSARAILEKMRQGRRK